MQLQIMTIRISKKTSTVIPIMILMMTAIVMALVIIMTHILLIKGAHVHVLF